MTHMIEKWGGALKYWASFGAAGMMAGWLVTVTLPQMQKSLIDSFEKQADSQREDRKDARDHGTEAAKELGSSIRDLTRTIDEHQTAVRVNQQRLIELQEKKP